MIKGLGVLEHSFEIQNIARVPTRYVLIKFRTIHEEKCHIIHSSRVPGGDVTAHATASRWTIAVPAFNLVETSFNCVDDGNVCHNFYGIGRGNNFRLLRIVRGQHFARWA